MSGDPDATPEAVDWQGRRLDCASCATLELYRAGRCRLGYACVFDRYAKRIDRHFRWNPTTAHEYVEHPYFEVRAIIARHVDVFHLQRLSQDADETVRLSVAMRIPQRGLLRMRDDPDREVRIRVAQRIELCSASSPAMSTGACASKSRGAARTPRCSRAWRAMPTRWSAKPRANTLTEKAMARIARDSNVVELDDPPRYDYGERVRSLKTIRNDGTFRGKEIGDILVRKGDVGYVTSIGTFLQQFYIYAVEFVDHGYRVGMKGREIESLDYIDESDEEGEEHEQESVHE